MLADDRRRLFYVVVVVEFERTRITSQMNLFIHFPADWVNTEKSLSGL